MRQLRRIVTRATRIDEQGRQELGPPDGDIQSVAFEGSVRDYEEQRYLAYLVRAVPTHMAHIVVDENYIYYTLTLEHGGRWARIGTLLGDYIGAGVRARTASKTLLEEVENRLAAKLRQILEKAERLAERERELAIIKAVTGKV